MTLTLSLVNKHYGEKHALVDLSYEFTNGIYGLLGPNGAGKSTMMNIITQNLEYDHGSKLLWNGEDTATLQAKYRSQIGFMPQYPGLYPNFTVGRFMWYMAALKGMKKADAKQHLFGHTPRAVLCAHLVRAVECKGDQREECDGTKGDPK